MDRKLIDEKLESLPTLRRANPQSVSQRNIAVHSYQNIDWTIVHRLCHESLDDFRKFATQVSRAADG